MGSTTAESSKAGRLAPERWALLMRSPASPRKFPDFALDGQGAATHQKLRVFFGIDVVGDDGHVTTRAQLFAESVDQCRFAGADRTCDTDAKRTFAIHCEKLS